VSTGGKPIRAKVIYGGKPQPGLYVRTTNDGRTVYEVCVKRGRRPIRRTLAAQTATDAVRESKKLIGELSNGKRLVGRTDISLRELLAQWEEWAKAPGSGYSARTCEHYPDRLIRHAFRILGPETKAAAVTVADIRHVIDKLNAEGLSGSTVRGVVTPLSALFRFGVRRGVLDTNPCRLLERGDRPSGKRTKEPRYLDRSEIDRLLGTLSEEFRPVAAVLAFAALRASEALALRWQDVDFDAGMLQVPGTKTAASAQPVPMTDDLVAELRAHRSRQRSLARVRPDALVFQTSNGTAHHRNNLGRAIRSAGTAAGLNPTGVKKVAPHDLRHSCAGLLLAARVPVPRVAAILRHSDVRTLLTVYAGVVEAERSELRGDLEAALR
jgi:integrase